MAAIKYDHQLRMLSALTKKFRETYQELSERDAANLARQRMERLSPATGMGPVELGLATVMGPPVCQ